VCIKQATMMLHRKYEQLESKCCAEILVQPRYCCKDAGQPAQYAEVHCDHVHGQVQDAGTANSAGARRKHTMYSMYGRKAMFCAQ
jgi:hypothetical protein